MYTCNRVYGCLSVVEQLYYVSAKAEHLKRRYSVADWANAEDFLGMVAK
jgi:hypothetical protein